MTPSRLDRARVLVSRAGDELAQVDLPAVTMTQLAFYCAAVGVTDPIHYDRDFARRVDFTDAVVNGSLRVAWMAQVLSDLVPAPGLLTQLSCTHRGIMLAGNAPHYSVRYIAHEVAADGLCLLHCEVMASADGKLCDAGVATLSLPD